MILDILACLFPLLSFGAHIFKVLIDARWFAAMTDFYISNENNDDVANIDVGIIHVSLYYCKLLFSALVISRTECMKERFGHTEILYSSKL